MAFSVPVSIQACKPGLIQACLYRVEGWLCTREHIGGSPNYWWGITPPGNRTSRLQWWSGGKAVSWGQRPLTVLLCRPSCPAPSPLPIPPSPPLFFAEPLSVEGWRNHASQVLTFWMQGPPSLPSSPLSVYPGPSLPLQKFSVIDVFITCSWFCIMGKLSSSIFFFFSLCEWHQVTVCCGGLVTWSCPTVCNPWTSPPGSSVHGISQARILEWVAISFSRISSQLRDQTGVSCVAGGLFTNWATREAQVGGGGFYL